MADWARDAEKYYNLPKGSITSNVSKPSDPDYGGKSGGGWSISASNFYDDPDNPNNTLNGVAKKGGMDATTLALLAAAGFTNTGGGWQQGGAGGNVAGLRDVVKLASLNMPAGLGDEMKLASMGTNLPTLPALNSQIQNNAPRYDDYKYEIKPFEYTPPNYSMTADRSNMIFVPTLEKKQQWNQEQQNLASQAQQNFANDMSTWKTNYDVGQDALARQFQQDQLGLQQQQLQQAQSQFDALLPYKQAESAATVAQKKAAATKALTPKATGAGGTSGGKTTVNDSAIAWINTNKNNFRGTYPAKKMYEQVKRDKASGKMKAALADAVMRNLEQLYMR